MSQAFVRSGLVLLGSGMLGAAVPDSVLAAPRIQEFASIGVGYNDNTLYTVDAPQNDGAAELSAGLSFISENESVRSKIEPKIDVHESGTDSGFSYIAPSLLVKSVSESDRADIGFALVVKKDSTIRSERVSTEESAGTGIVVSGKDRLFLSARPSWNYRVTPTQSLRADFYFSDIDYNDAEDFGLYDYDYQRLTFRYVNELTEKMDVWVGPSYGKYTSFERDSRGLTVGVSSGIDMKVTERTTYGGSLGWLESSSDLADDRFESSSAKVKIYLVTRSETSSTRLTYDKNVVPSGAGELYETDRLLASFNGKVGSVGVIRLDTIYQKTRTFNAAGLTGDERESIGLDPSFSWRLSPIWSFDVSYKFDTESRGNENRDRSQFDMKLTYRAQERFL